MPVDLLPTLSVSRETEQRLQRIQSLLEKWNPAINLVSKATIPSAWQRHILDSAQLYAEMDFDHWADLGSGGGFPGLVIAALAAEKNPSGTIVLVEVDKRKATFLREAVRMLGLRAEVIAERIENLAPLNVDVLSARALAPLPLLCEYALRHLDPGGTALFLKGAGWRDEVSESQRLWAFDYDVVPSETDPSAVILKVKAIKHV